MTPCLRASRTSISRARFSSLASVGNILGLYRRVDRHGLEIGRRDGLGIGERLSCSRARSISSPIRWRRRVSEGAVKHQAGLTNSSPQKNCRVGRGSFTLDRLQYGRDTLESSGSCHPTVARPSFCPVNDEFRILRRHLVERPQRSPSVAPQLLVLAPKPRAETLVEVLIELAQLRQVEPPVALIPAPKDGIKTMRDVFKRKRASRKRCSRATYRMTG